MTPDLRSFSRGRSVRSRLEVCTERAEQDEFPNAIPEVAPAVFQGAAHATWSTTLGARDQDVGVRHAGEDTVRSALDAMPLKGLTAAASLTAKLRLTWRW